MPQLIGVVIVIAIVIAYFKAMAGWFEYFFLDAFLLAAFIALTVAPIVYGYGAWRTFQQHAQGQWRALLWLPILALLLWLYFDLAVLIDAVVALMRASESWPDWLRYQDSRLLNALRPFLSEYTQVQRLGIHALLGLPVGQAGTAASWLYALYGLVLKVTAIVALLLTLRGLDNDYQDHAEPAFRQYFFGAAWLDLRGLLKASAEGIGAYYERVGTFLSACFGDYAVITWVFLVVAWPLAIAVAMAFFILPLLLGAVFLPLLFGIHALALAVFALLFISLALALFGIERSILFLRSGWAKCPHPKCYRPVVLPVYRCQCGAEHKRLVPGRCGVFQRVCSNCRRTLPTLSWFGKQNLAAECSHAHCRKPLHHALFSGNLTLPLYGGAAAGKTMFRNAALVQLLQGRQPDLKAEFIDANDGADYRTRIEPAFARGQVAAKTTALQPPAFLLSLRRRATQHADGLPVSLYLYDPDGAMTDSEVQRDQQRYLHHAGGLALLIDPLSLPSLREVWQKTGTPLPPGTCESDPLSLVEGLLAALEGHTGVGADRRFRQRLAVILTKGDLPLVQRTLGVSAAAPSADEAWDTFDSTTSARIRDWLRDHEPALLQRLERRFARVQFFLVSAMGHDASAPGPFAPKRVLEPVLWLLSAHRALSHPLVTRVGMTAAEVSIVAVLTAAFALVPLAGVNIAGGLLDLARQPIAHAPPLVASARPALIVTPPSGPVAQWPQPARSQTPTIPTIPTIEPAAPVVATTPPARIVTPPSGHVMPGTQLARSQTPTAPTIPTIPTIEPAAPVVATTPPARIVTPPSGHVMPGTQPARSQTPTAPTAPTAPTTPTIGPAAPVVATTPPARIVTPPSGQVMPWTQPAQPRTPTTPTTGPAAPVLVSIAIVQNGVAGGLTTSNRPLPFREQFTPGEVPLVYFVRYRDATIGTVLTAHWLQENTEITQAPYTISQTEGDVSWRSPALLPGRHRVRLTLNGRELASADFMIAAPEATPQSEPAPGDGEAAVVTAIRLNVRDGPGTAYQVLFKLYQDQPVHILERRTLHDGDVWGRITAAVGSGWVNTALLRVGPLTVTEAKSVGVSWVNATQINVRSGPGPDYPSVGKLPRGTKIAILERRTVGEDSEWARIEANGTSGWANSRFLGALNDGRDSDPVTVTRSPKPSYSASTEAPQQEARGSSGRAKANPGKSERRNAKQNKGNRYTPEQLRAIKRFEEM